MHKAMLSASMMCAPQWVGADKVIEELHAHGVELLHADVMDGEFVPNFMLGTDGITQLRKLSPMPLDIHMMIERPEEKLHWFNLQPGEWVSIHAESTHHLQRALFRVRDFGAKPMVALSPATPVFMIEDVLPDVDGVLVMTVNPGFAGQRMIPQTLGKISRMRSWLNENGYSHLRIEVDGNVSFENAKKMRAAGADIFVCGTASIFSKEGARSDNIARVRASVSDE